jgi:putative transposase
MPFAYKIYDQHRPHFITCTVHQWVDVFSRKQYADIFLDSIRYCQANKGLKVYAWVIMTNHLHLIIGSHTHPLSDIIRDFKNLLLHKL